MAHSIAKNRKTEARAMFDRFLSRLTGFFFSTKEPIYESGHGVLLGRTRITQIDGRNGTLHHRGYAIEELAAYGDFVETTALLLNAKLPSQEERRAIANIIERNEYQRVDGWLITPMQALSRGPWSRKDPVDPMVALQSLIAALGLEQPWHGYDPAVVRTQGLEILAKMPTLATGIFHMARRHDYTSPSSRPFTANLLWMLNTQEPDPEDVRLLDTLLLLHADHGYNNSAFTARVVISSGTQVASALSAAIGSLLGPRHGGANRDTFALFEATGSPENVEPYVRQRLYKNPKWKFPGCGHRVYKTIDPRAKLIKPIAKRLCEKHELPWFDIAEEYERVALKILHEEMGKTEVWPNVDLFAAAAFGVFVPREFLPVFFAIGRIPGWVAHMMEELETGAIFRPDGKYDGPEPRPYVPQERRP